MSETNISQRTWPWPASAEANLIPHIQMASDLGQLASDLDDYKNKLPLPLQSSAEKCVNAMHAFAQELLGEHVGEVYDREEETHL